MTAEQFVYWLQGFIEINDPTNITSRETQIIKDHLALVFKKETPTRIGTGYGVPNKTEIVTNPYEKGYPVTNPYTITCTGTDPNSTATGRVIC
jgi:hypothetical protein